MKNIRKFLFLFILFSFTFFSDNVYAKEKQMTCDYAITQGESGDGENSEKTKLFFRVDVYDDGSNEKFYFSNKLDFTRLNDHDNYLQIGQLGAKCYTNDVETGDCYPMGANISLDLNSFKLKDNGDCYDAVVNLADPTMGIYELFFTDDGFDWINGNAGSHYAKANATYTSESNVPKKDKIVETSSCTVPVSGMNNIDFTFKMFSDGTKKFNIQPHNKDKTGDFDATELAAYYMESLPENKFNNLYWYMTIPDDQLSKIYIQKNFHELDNNQFTCPDRIYLSEPVTYNDIGVNINITADESDLNSSELVGGGGASLVINGGNSIDLGEFEGCNILSKNSEFGKYIVSVLNFIKIIAILLIIFLSIIDAIKSFIASDDKQNKQFYKRLLNRLICCAILFLLPSIIIMILNIFNSNSIISNVSQNPFCNLI